MNINKVKYVFHYNYVKMYIMFNTEVKEAM